MTDRWPEIDELIVHRRIVPAIVILREEFGYGIREAIDAFGDRYEQLRDLRPEDFTLSPEEYFKGFYS
ncbi:hypothetical protein AB0L00_21460 [Actinoallomurus sp. NPDC052308]|uniref:hypothetical protein n=1 Tax=Actinoallomurus sp. NPDC052308 TaxID=3155530 RepID=UPI003432BA99